MPLVAKIVFHEMFLKSFFDTQKEREREREREKEKEREKRDVLLLSSKQT